MRRTLITWLVLLATSFAAASPAAVAERRRRHRIPIVVVVPRTSPIENLPMAELRRLFTLSYPSPLRPLNLPPRTRERVAFDALVLGRAPEEVVRFWIDRRIRGQAGPPRVVPTGHLLVRIVARVPDTIGYAIGVPLPEGTKAIRIDGFSPDDPRYPIFVMEEE